MDNLVLQRGSIVSSNFNNMTDQQLLEWHRALLTEAQRENYINENLEIVRHYRTEALSRAQAFNVERNAIDAAIARHGLYAPNGDASTIQEEAQPPPMRRARIEPEPPENQYTASCKAGGGGDSGTHSLSICKCNCTRYRSLEYIFENYMAPTAAEAAAGDSNKAGSSSDNLNTNNNSINHYNNNNDSSSKNNNEPEESELNDLAINNSIDSLGLRRA